MATCANCIHHSLCDYNTNISGNGKVRLVYAEGADVKCSFFQNTADVVPKSEVEELQAKVEMLRKENIGLLVSKETDILISMEKLVKVRTEHPIVKAIEERVAREIFDDIANMMVLQHGFNEKHIVAHIDFELLKELKKKYTEGADNE